MSVPQTSANVHVWSCSLCSGGVVQLYVNQWIHINFSLPHKVHMAYSPGTKVTVRTLSYSHTLSYSLSVVALLVNI